MRQVIFSVFTLYEACGALWAPCPRWNLDIRIGYAEKIDQNKSERNVSLKPANYHPFDLLQVWPHLIGLLSNEYHISNMA